MISRFFKSILSQGKNYFPNKIILMIGLAMLSLNGLRSQATLRGTVVDYDIESLAFANVVLYNAEDSSLYKGTISDEKGHFIFQSVYQGQYLLEVSMIGFESQKFLITVDEKLKEQHLGSFTLSENTTLIDGVTVTARKLLFEKKADRTIINVQSNAINKGNTILNVLRSSPGIMVGREDITMAGKQGVRIMLNGKIVRMPIDGVMQMLEGMSASNVEKIELITNPGAQFEAEGNAGFINILFRESPDSGWTANLGATAGMNQGLNAGSNASIQYRSSKIALSGNYAINYDDNDHIWNVYQSKLADSFLSYSDGKTSRNARILNQNLNLGLNYNFTSKTELSFSLSGNQHLHLQEDFNTTEIAHATDSTSTILTNVVEPNNWLNGSISIGLHHNISKSAKIKIFYDHLRYQNVQKADYDLSFTNNKSSQILRSNLNTKKTTPIRFHVISTDYLAEINKNISVSLGGKLALSKFANEVETDLTGFPIYDISIIQPQTFLSENIYAAYTQFTYNINPLWKLKGGLRFEHTSTNIKNATQENIVLREYGNWFPGLNVSYKLKENSSFQLAYSRRITRPTFNDLAPFVFFQNPSTLIQGNSSLLPAIMHGLDFTYTRGKHWITFQYGRTANFISFFIPEIVEENTVTYSTQNLDFMEMLSIIINPNIQFTSWWASNNSISLQNFTIEDNGSGEKLSRSVNNFLVNSNHSFTINQSISANISLNYNHRGFIGLVEYKPQWMMNTAISKRLKNGSQCSLRLTDIFASYLWQGSFNSGKAVQSFYFDQNLRAIDFSWSMPLGNNKLKSVKVKNGSASERARVN